MHLNSGGRACPIPALLPFAQVREQDKRKLARLDEELATERSKAAMVPELEATLGEYIAELEAQVTEGAAEMLASNRDCNALAAHHCGRIRGSGGRVCAWGEEGGGAKSCAQVHQDGRASHYHRTYKRRARRAKTNDPPLLLSCVCTA